VAASTRKMLPKRDLNLCISPPLSSTLPVAADKSALASIGKTSDMAGNRIWTVLYNRLLSNRDGNWPTSPIVYVK
jgi:hypothetical protein